MSTPRKRKFIDLTDDSPHTDKKSKKAKLSPSKATRPVAFAQQNLDVCPLPPLEKDERFENGTRCKDNTEKPNSTDTDTSNTTTETSTDSTSAKNVPIGPPEIPTTTKTDVTNDSPPHSPSPTFSLNQWVHLNRNDTRHKAQILKQKEKNEKILYLIHYDQLSSVHDEWVPKHKLHPIDTIEQSQDEVTESNDHDVIESGEPRYDTQISIDQIAPIESAEDQNQSISNDDVSALSAEKDLKVDDITNDITNDPSDDPSDPSSPSTVIHNQRLLDLLAPSEPAKSFPFELDHFQFNAIKSLETETANLLITAHTSAGKTVVAEYAIAKALANNQRVIYTSPIKALSNQKYREFTETFGHSQIGLITGDVTKRRDASVLVMTTEILRNMLYKGGSELREVAYVVFDEVHYMRDMERGVVWEESIILLNSKITLIFLSATLSNAEDFALWVTDLKGKTCRVFGTEKRPIVLEHYVLPQGSDSLYLVASSATKNLFLSENFEHAQGHSGKQKTYRQMDEERKRNKLKVSDLQLLLYMLYKNNWVPAIVFAFSKREVEGHALVCFG